MAAIEERVVTASVPLRLVDRATGKTSTFVTTYDTTVREQP